MKRIHLTLLIIVCLFTACDKLLLNPEFSDNPEDNFEAIWGEFDAKYGLFEIKRIDWDSVYQAYRPTITNRSSDLALYTTITEMMALLNDCHVALLPTSSSSLPMYQSGILGRIDTINDFDLEIVKRHYLSNAQFEDPFFTYGVLSDNIGYIHIEGFSDSPKFLEKPFDKVLSALQNTDAIIIDVRGGYGGEDIAGQYLAGRFTTTAIPYMQTRVKAGPDENDFTAFQQWLVRPEGDFQYNKPIVVLTHRFTISARETFCLAMKVIPNVTFVGDTTAGAFSNQINREMPNGWGYSLSIGQWVDANGISYEGIGLAPNVVVLNQKSDVLSGTDEALEKGIDLLK